MITLAFDAATDRCTVAATDGRRVASRFVDGSRQHAAALLGLIGESLAEIGASPSDVDAVITGDGPGSFTGLRVATAVAKAIAWRRSVTWNTAPSLLIRAAAHAPPGGGAVLALSDALRGELYAGCWTITAGQVRAIGPTPRAMRPETLATFGTVDVVVGTIPAACLDAVTIATGLRPITGVDALPDARALLALREVPGAVNRVDSPEAWEPDYGRPAEAQAAWEREHGRPLPTSPGFAG